MCNLYTQSKSPDEIARLFREQQISLRFPEGIPNLQPRDIRITDPAPIVRSSPGPDEAFELVVRRWSWPGQGGKPVYNFRSDGREFSSGRCLILADGFYEFTAPADAKQKRKDRWLFSRPAGELIAIAGLLRDDPGRGEAFTMLTTEPGPDVAPYHGRQVAVLQPDQWMPWLTYAQPASALLGPAPAGTLEVSAANAA
ncbi:SOS response-associated peptidase [Sphingomonas sp.]|uniref:SOS response-associated peptidase n=1 Tax=Sphingomonas sp. TaxID=28214 RepID=UPI0038A14B2A